MRRVLVLGVALVAGLLVLWFAFADRGPGGEDGADTVKIEAAGSEETRADDAARVPRERLDTEHALPEPDVAQEPPEEPPPFRYEVLHDDLPRGTVLVVECEDPGQEGWYVWSYVHLAGDRELRPFARREGSWPEIHFRLPDGRLLIHDWNPDRDEAYVFSLLDPRSGDFVRLTATHDLEYVGVTPLGLLVYGKLEFEPAIEFVSFDSPEQRQFAARGTPHWVQGRFPGGAMYTAEIIPPTDDGDAPTDDEFAETERWLLRLDEADLGRALTWADYGHERSVQAIRVAPDGEHVALTFGLYAETEPTQSQVIEIRDGRTGELTWRIEQDADAPQNTVWLDSRRLRYLDLVEERTRDGSAETILHAVDVDVVSGERVGFHRVGPEDSALAEAVELEVFAGEMGLPPRQRGPFRLVEVKRPKPDHAELKLYVGAETIPALGIGDRTGGINPYRPIWFSPERRHVFVGLGPDTETREYALVTADPRRRTDYTLTNVRAVWWLGAVE